MNVASHLVRLGGVASRADLIAETSRADVDLALAAGEIVRLSRGRYAAPVAHDALRAAGGLCGVVSHRSAALHWGWQVKQPPPHPDVTVPRSRRRRAHYGSDVCLHWADLAPGDIDGWVTSRRRTLVDCLRLLPFDEALTIADSALRNGSVTPAELRAIAAGMSGRGARRARRIADAASPLAANPFESVLRAIGLDVPGLDLRPQVVIADKQGRGRPDLVDVERRLVVEAESHSWHSRRGALRRDCRRYTKLVLLDWRVLRFAWEDVMFHPDYVRECLEAFVALVDGPTKVHEARKSAA
ncbi:hypothetical protein [Nocardioides mesophilus]|uniref:DUF559 domain-containing protein n=1 Tax=Nocardioides mesophilus TaxID=433659 RepID=A0A7G9R8S9_9ACTN|nr:hypothetical protein [Nocardioides mesophilus]QNN52004.1 hypothetical protein H9L09_16005 [Nocardioides mesophilus]